MRRILFVEDDPLVARMYSQKLTQAEFDVEIAPDGLAAIKRLPTFKPDLVVLDLLMPKLSGVDVLRFIRQDPNLKETRVVVFSNEFLNKLGEEAAQCGVDDVLSKPAATPQLLIEMINKVLQRAPAAKNVVVPPIPIPQVAAPPPPAPKRPRDPDTAPPPGLPAPPPPPASSFEPPRESGQTSPALFFRRMQQDFFERIPVIAKSVQQVCKQFLEAGDHTECVLRLETLSRKIGFLTHMTGMAGCYRVAQLSSALEALLFELWEKPETINESARRTVASTVSLLTDFLERAGEADEQCLSPTTVLVVEDDVFTSRVLVMALARGNMKADRTADPFEALRMLKQNYYDVVLLDINLPGMDGIKLSEHLRALPHHKQTPVIFLTQHPEYEPQTRAILATGGDFITKPVLPIELTVKIALHTTKRRLAEQAPPAASD